MLQSVVSIALPIQTLLGVSLFPLKLPLCISAVGLIHVLVLVFVPSPHVTEQDAQALHCDQYSLLETKMLIQKALGTLSNTRKLQLIKHSLCNIFHSNYLDCPRVLLVDCFPQVQSKYIH